MKGRFHKKCDPESLRRGVPISRGFSFFVGLALKTASRSSLFSAFLHAPELGQCLSKRESVAKTAILLRRLRRSICNAKSAKVTKVND